MEFLRDFGGQAALPDATVAGDKSGEDHGLFLFCPSDQLVLFGIAANEIGESGAPVKPRQLALVGLKLGPRNCQFFGLTLTELTNIAAHVTHHDDARNVARLYWTIQKANNICKNMPHGTVS